MDDDYIKGLSYDEKLAFLKIFCKLIKADNSVDNQEVDFLKLAASRYGVSNDEIVGIIKNADSIYLPDEVKHIVGRQHALELIKELCVLANVDSELHDNELDVIIDVARFIGIEDEKVLLINRWVLDSAIVAKTGQIIMERTNG